MVSFNSSPCVENQSRCLSIGKDCPEPSQTSEKINNTVLGSQLLNACQSGNRDEVDSILSKITCFDALKMVDLKMISAFSHAINNGMRDVAIKISDKEFSFLIDACKSNDLKCFEYICKRMEKYDFRYSRCSPEELTLIFETYSNLLKDNWENGRQTTVDLNSVLGSNFPGTPYNRQHCVKRCAENSLCHSDRDSASLIDNKTYNIVLGSQLLSACKSGDSDKALNIISEITCFDTLKMVDRDNKTAFSYALANKMDAVYIKINNKKFSLLLDACKNNDLDSFVYVYKRIHGAIFDKNRYTTDELTLILKTHSDVLRNNWENGNRSTVDLNPTVRSYTGEASNRTYLKRYAEEDDLYNVCMKSSYSGLNQDETTHDIVLGSQLLNACENGNSAEAFHIVSKIRNYDSLIMKDKKGKTPIVCAMINKMKDVAIEINDKKFSLLLDACKSKDLKTFIHIYKDLHKLILGYKKYTDEDRALIAQTYTECMESSYS